MDGNSCGVHPAVEQEEPQAPHLGACRGKRSSLGASACCDVETGTGIGGKCFPREWAAPWRPALGMGCPGMSAALVLKTQFCSLSLE